MWQHVKLSEQIRPCDTLACCWDVKQPTNKQTNFCGVLAFLSATCVVGWQSSVVDVDLFQVLLCVSRCLTDRPLTCVTQTDYRMGLLVGWLVALCPSNILVHLRDGSAQTSVRAATLMLKLQIKLSTSPSHRILTPGQPFPVLTL